MKSPSNFCTDCLNRQIIQWNIQPARMVTILDKWYIIKPHPLCWRAGGLTRLGLQERGIHCHRWYLIVITKSLSSPHIVCIVRSVCILFRLPLLRMNLSIDPIQCNYLWKFKVRHTSHFFYPILITCIQVQHIRICQKHSNNPKTQVSITNSYC